MFRIDPHTQKRKQILEAALKRFSHFGVNKTTMSEIASDVSISKANLYYYFADKTDLVIGVFNQLFDQMEYDFRKRQSAFNNTLSRLDQLLDLRRIYMEQHYLVHMTLTHSDSNVEIDRLKGLAKTSDQRLCQLVAHVFSVGQQEEELVTFDVNATSKTYLNIIQGIGFQYFFYLESKDIPDRSIFCRIYQDQVAATSIFVNGLRYPLDTHQNLAH